MNGLEEMQPAQELRVAHVIGRLSIGGAEKHFVSLLNEIRASERWAIFTSPSGEGATLEDQLDPDIEIIRFPVRKRSAVWGVYRLSRRLRMTGVNVVHTHMFWPSLYGVAAARLAGVPVIVTTEHGENKWKGASHRFLERRVISAFAKRRFCVSEAILAARRDIDRVPEEILALTVNGTPVPRTPARLWSNERPVIGTVGRAVTQKNYHLFVDVVNEVRKRGHDVDAYLIGDGPLLEEVRAHIARQNLSDHVFTPGMSQDVESWYRKFDIYLISSDQEGQPVSLLEAMSYGLPIVTTDVGAIGKTMRHGKEGLIGDAGDVRQLADAVCRFIDHRDFADSCGRAARSRVIKDFSIETVARRYEDAYNHILNDDV